MYIIDPGCGRRMREWECPGAAPCRRLSVVELLSLSLCVCVCVCVCVAGATRDQPGGGDVTTRARLDRSLRSVPRHASEPASRNKPQQTAMSCTMSCNMPQ